MRVGKVSGLSSAICAVLAIAPAARASVIFSDSFAYPDGNLVGQGPWVQQGTTTTNPVQLSGGQVLLGTSGQDVEAPLSTAITSGSIYYGADIDVTASGSGDYFLHTRSTGSSFAARLYAKTDPNGGYDLGLGLTSAAASYGATALTLGQTYHVVVRYDFVAGTSNDTAALYVNPADALDQTNDMPYVTAVQTAGTGDNSSSNNIDFRQGGGNTAAPTVTVDNLVVSTDFASSAASAAATPEPTGLALLAVASLGITARRRRPVLDRSSF